MATHGEDILIKDTLVFLFAAGVAVPVFRFLKLPAVVGFMVSGIILGPYALGALTERWPVLEFISISEPEGAAPFAELGVLFLLFLLGLEFSFEKLWGLRRTVFGIGGLQAALSAIAISLVVGALGVDIKIAMVVGLALALSSTAIVMQLLVENREAAKPVGRTSFGVLLFQDVLVAPILIFVGLVNLNADEKISTVLLEASVQGLIAIAIIFLIGKFVLRRLFQMVASSGGRDFLMALTLLTVVGAAAITATAGLSLALGAFLAGILLGETEFKHQTEVDLEPFKGILLGLFFMTVGMGLDIPGILGNPGLIIAGLLGLLALKLIAAFLAVYIFERDARLSIETAFFLAPAGEFAFVVLATATASGLMPSDIGAPLAAVAGLSMLGIPPLSRLGKWLAGLNRKTDEEVTDNSDFSDERGHVIVAGFGRVGQVIARVLTHEEAEIVAIERSPKLAAAARDSGWKAYIGDASRPEMLHSVGIDGAALFIATIDDARGVEAMTRAVRAMRPDIPIIARAHDHEHAVLLKKAGANHVVPEVVEAGLQMAGEALHQYGYDSETVRSKIAMDRDEEYQRDARENTEAV